MDTRINLPAEARFESRATPRLAAGLLALGVHLLFAVLLVFGVSWQTQKPEPVMVDVWNALPKVAPQPQPPTPRPVPRPEPPAPVPRVEKPPVAEPPPPVKPDIALEKKREAEQLRKMLAEEDARARAEAEKERRAAEKKQLQQQQREDEALARRMAEDEAAAQAQVAKASAARAAAAQRQTELSRLVGQYQDLISAKVRGNTRLPENLQGNPEVRCLVKLLPTGEVVAPVRIVKSSGNAAYDDAVVRAIEKSSPLPLPPDREARAAFVPELSFVHRPKE